MTAHTKGLLRVGKNGAVVADAPVPEISGSDAVEYYGGHLVAESITPANARRIVACWNLLHEFDTEAIEAGTFADFIGKQVYQHEIGNANSGELRLSDVSLQLMAAGFAGKMKANAAENYMEFGLLHPETGPITLTVQRTEGFTPAQKLAAMTKQRDVLLDAVRDVRDVMNDSQGVAGWHQNGAIATWDELLPEVAAALEFVEGEKS
ncbi:hypothetical protein GPK29_11700 [Aeromonas hydrophila]|uniref:acetylxylan esterase n=1 Tax=Aeromonas hydrophila TaxID=644 RepID=UPI001C5B067F|nr:acetylxylan esterase [Aeromonas hydrophila]MBW3797775.1 hypothetical protein [Aeromonas hydrophila]MBW3801715.1 hypothetical protein [Aeromonas hydrophila]MBW3819271.1 hypothetical protein [Aeromonas hydrophila]